MADFLFEIGLEEVPARMIAGAQTELFNRVIAMLERERLIPPGTSDTLLRTNRSTHPREWSGYNFYSTPRRLAVVIEDVAGRQQDVSEQMMGPAVKIAYKDGQPGPAAVAFAKKAGVAIEELKIVETAKGEYVAATSVKAGRAAAEVIASELPKELAGIYWAKNMYWRAGKPERFVRPVRWLVALLGDEVVPVSFGGYEAGRMTFGHRVLHGAEPLAVTPATYVEALRGAFVEPDVEARRHTIRKALDRVCRAAGDGLRWREDHALVDKMTHLTEWPSVIAGGFEREFLALPEEVLVTVMRDHQNHFAVQTKDGKLAPHFLAVLNTAADAAGEAVIRHGNERVLRARFNDARFFWEFDQRVPLEERVALLEHVTFQKDLGSYAAKSLRVAEVARSLAWTAKERGLKVDQEALEDATRLAKTDLTTELVKEFTELQGQIGGLYAEVQGVSSVAAKAIYDQYRPVSMEDRIPATIEGQLLAIADKADSIAGMFGLGMEPTGSKDPFALRRAANGIVKILGEAELPLRLAQVVAASGALGPVADKVSAFFAERLEFYLREARGQAYDVVKAVLVVGADDVRDAVARAEAVTAVRGSADFEAVSTAFKRMKNILAQAAEKGYVVEDFRQAGGDRFPFEEQELLMEAEDVSKRAHEFCKQHAYTEALVDIATLRPAIDTYFEKVMILDPDPQVRSMRLGMLRFIAAQVEGIADLAEIVVAG